MIFSCNGLDLADALTKVSQALPQRATSPILNGIKFEAEGDFVKVTATDLEFTISKLVKADVKMSGEVLVPGKIVEEYIKDGRIKVNGRVVTNLATDINLKKDKCQFDDKDINMPKEYVYYKLHKPKGYICSASDEKGRKTIYEIVKTNERLFSVGRLDYNSEGLLILTNDGVFANKITHPANHIEKEYIVKIEGNIKESELAVLRAGVVENGKKMPKAKVKLLSYENNQSRLSVIIDEGQNHQIRRMFDCIGKTIILLKRVSVGGLKLGGLPRGKYKELSQSELDLIFEAQKWKLQ